MEEVVLLPAMIYDEKTKTYIHNPNIVGGLDIKGIQAFKLDFARLFKWGIINQRVLQEINKVSEDVEVIHDTK